MKRRVILALVFLPALLLWVLILFAHPFFAVNKPCGADVLVVEGWFYRGRMPEIARLVRDGGYPRVFTTGVERPVSCYLKPREVYAVELQPQLGALHMEIAGLPGARYAIVADADTLVSDRILDQMQQFTADPGRVCTSWQVVCLPRAEASDTVDELFIRDLSIGGLSVHAPDRKTWIVHADGTRDAGLPTYADEAASWLEECGLPRSMITAVPTWEHHDGRTWGSARDLAAIASRERIEALDVVTLGVHARRTRGLYRKACGKEVTVGVISLPDPWCRPNDWWRHWYGWWKILKEIVGAHQPYTASRAE